MLNRLTARNDAWDLLVIGGGATGVGVAVDAASRGYAVLLVEACDFGQGTSSRSTKLVHGGVRYLERGDVSLVREALRERSRLLNNAPHLVHDRSFLLPTYRWWEAPFYGIGLKLYDALAGRDQFGSSRYLPRREVIRRLPTLQTHGLRGGILYHDGQFDDSRLLINLVQTAMEQGATVLNYARVVKLVKRGDAVTGAIIRDEESGTETTVTAKGIVNATGAFCDAVRALADPLATAIVAPSQGTHIVLDRSFLPGDTALMVPKTPDGRVMFAIPWHGHVLVGTTDVAVAHAEIEPRPTHDEIDFLLETTGRYLAKAPTRADVLSTFAGIRPLVKATGTKNTAALSRDHTIHVDASGLLTITGGKWTTYRNMAEDCVNRAAALGHLPYRRCITATLPIHGHSSPRSEVDPLAVYGSDAVAIRELQESNARYAQQLHPDYAFTAAEVVWAVRHEMARTVEDVLSRRIRILLLNAKAAATMARPAAALMAQELGRDAAWQEEQVDQFERLSRGYQIVD